MNINGSLPPLIPNQLQLQMGLMGTLIDVRV
jgi:hypothetical protein